MSRIWVGGVELRAALAKAESGNARLGRGQGKELFVCQGNTGGPMTWGCTEVEDFEQCPGGNATRTLPGCRAGLD